MEINDPAYSSVIDVGRQRLGEAGFSEREVESWIREYDEDIAHGRDLNYVKQRIEESARARSERLAREGLRQPVSQPRSEEGLLGDRTYIGLAAASAGLVYVGSCVHQSFVGNDSAVLGLVGLGVAVGLPFAALVGLALCGDD